MTLVVPGRPGAVSGLRPLTELREATDGAIEHLCKLQLGRLITGRWSVHEGPVWSVPFSEIFDGEPMVVDGVQSLRDAGLRMVESLADCLATEGSFFRDSVADAGHRWGDAVTRWGRWQWAGADLGIPTAVYEFEADGSDLSPNGHDLTEINGPAYAPAVNHLGAQLTRITDNTDSPHFTLAHHLDFDPETESFVVALKARFDSLEEFVTLATKGGNTVSGWRLFARPTTDATPASVSFRLRVGAGIVVVTTPAASISTGTYHSIVAVVDRVSDLALVFIDGQLLGSGDISSLASVTNASQALWIGTNVEGTARPMDGRIDQAMFFKGLEWATGQALSFHAGPAGEPPGPNPVAGARWGAFPRLYVHLANGSSPRTTEVIAYLSVWLSERGQAVPHFGSQKLTDPGFEDWLSPADLEHYSEDLAIGITLAREEALVRSGSFAARVNFDGTGLGGFYQAQPAVPGLWYRLHGEYWTDPEMDAQDLAVVRLGNPTDGWLEPDGRGVGASAQIGLQRTGGEWRRFYVDAIAHSATLRAWAGVQAVSGSRGSVVFDRLELVPIFSWQQAHPRLEGPAPSAEVGTNDSLFGGDRAGRGEIVAVNADGFLARLLGTYEALGKSATFYESGAFRSGQAIPADDWRAVFSGRTERPVVTDQRVRIPLRDIRGELHRLIPPRRYSRLDQPRVVPSADGTHRPVFFGPKTGIAPVRIDLSDDGLGVYELADTGWDMPFPISPAGLQAVDSVYAYASKEAADARDVTQRALLMVAVDYAVDLARGTVTLLRHVGPFILEDDLMLDFDTDGSTTVTATIVAGTYASIDSLAETIQTAIRITIGGGDTTGLCEFDLSLKLVRLGRTAGTFNLRASTGPNRDIGIYPLIGFASSSDQTGQSSYEGSVLLEDPDQQHVIRVDAQGYRDDSAGTYTGTADALVTKGADVARLVWHRLQRRPLDLVDEPSFAAARAARPATLGLYLRSELSTLDVLQTLKISTLSDIVVDGAGRINYVPYTSVVPASAETLEDRDYLSWSMSQPIRDIYAEILVEYDEDAATGIVKTRRVASPAVALTAGRPDSRAERVYQVVGNDAQGLARDLAKISAARPREVTLSLKSRLRDARPGQIVLLTRADALDATGSLQAAPFRVASVVAAAQVQLRLVELVAI